MVMLKQLEEKESLPDKGVSRRNMTFVFFFAKRK